MFHQGLGRSATRAWLLLVVSKTRTAPAVTRITAPLAATAGLTPTAVLQKLATIQMLDVYLPTTDNRFLVLPRYTNPEPEHELLLSRMKLSLPPQPPPRRVAG